MQLQYDRDRHVGALGYELIARKSHRLDMNASERVRSFLTFVYKLNQAEGKTKPMIERTAKKRVKA